ncbi:MAG TPA: roadblock/LC7 domain-containing protein [Gaiellaceae bacterium]|nr:roadblock/LC7 domain-containing protein [Gaiellaceae bacterium]
MDAEHAIADLMEVSSQVDGAVLVGPGGDVEASSLPSERAERLARTARQLLEAAAAGSDRELSQLEVATRDGSVFVVRDGERTLAATTGPSATVGLVFYDLRTCLRSLAEADAAPAKPKRRRRKQEPAEAPAEAATPAEGEAAAEEGDGGAAA